MKKGILHNALTVSLLLITAGCTLEPYIITTEEEYTRSFIKRFGLIDPEMDWNMAKSDVVTVNLGDNKASSVKVYCLSGSKYYLIADIDKVSGSLDIPVDVPKSAKDIMVKVDGKKFFGNLGTSIDCTGLSRGVPESASGASYPTNPTYSATQKVGSSNYAISVSHATQQDAADMHYTAGNVSGNYEYQYFNTRQISPIVSKTPWAQYKSLGTGALSALNTENHIGLLPESGIYNRTASEIEDWIAQKQSEGYDMNIDFTFDTNNEGKFVIFPFYYGTNLQHELGVYLVDDDGLPLLKSGGKAEAGNSSYTLDDFISFPIFKTRDHGDLQVQPHYDNHITGIRVNIEGNITSDIYLNYGETYNLQQYVEVQLNYSEWIPYNTYIAENGAKTHSRVAYHLWVDEANSASDPKPVEYATCDRDGIITPKAFTLGHGHDNNSYGVVAIPTGMEDGDTGTGRVIGVQQNLNIHVTSSAYTLEIDTSNLPSVMTYSGGVLTIPITYDGELPLTVKKNGTIVSPFDVSQIYIKGNDNSFFTIYRSDADNKIKVRANAEGKTSATIKISNGTPLSFDINVNDPSAVIHTWTGTYSTWPGGLEYSDYEETSAPSINLFSGSQDLGNYSTQIEVENSRVSSAEVGDKIRITFVNCEKDDDIQICGSYYTPSGYAWVTIGGKWDLNVGDTSFETTLTSDHVGYIKSNGFLVQGTVTVTRVDLVDHDGTPVTIFNQSAAEAAIATYYKSNAIGGSCIDDDGATISSTETGVNISVTINSVSAENINYTVTLSKKSTSMSAPRRRTTTNKVTAPLSREGTYDMTGLLTEDNTIGWLDVSSYWTRNLRAGEEVSSYPVDMDMLGRTRGYAVKITIDGHAYYGKLGAYLKVVGSNDLQQDEGKESTGVYTYDSNKYPYTVFSQRIYNRAGTEKPYTTPYPQISAVSVIHPSSGNTFLSFEDMLVTHSGDTFKYYEKSSDRDVNDVIFKVYGLNTSKPHEEEDEGFPWILAVEDLGATDDFDFNDLVVKISSVTKRLITPGEGKDPDTETYLSKKVIFTPLAAGGTLPLYLQWNKYTLAPGTYYLGETRPEGISAQSISVLSGDPTTVGKEIHKWFGNYPSTTMLNTSTPGKPGSQCIIYVPINENTGSTDPYNFTISGFGTSTTSVDASETGNNIGIKVYVSDTRDNQIGAISSGWTVSRPEEGKVSQMFIIYDTESRWCWPKERVPINTAYPSFNDWISDPSINWFSECTASGYVITPRQD